MDLVYFIILVSSLVFVHELGHFMCAKAFGAKVLTFSLGFGPKLLRFRGRETEYCVGLIPLGGYVSMLQESKNDVVHPEDRHRTFESLHVYKRIVIVLAGPLMNLLFPVLLYFSVFVTAGPLLPPTIGVVLPGHPADGRLRPGDRVMAVDGDDIGTFDELKAAISKNPGRPLALEVFRDNHHLEVEVTPEETVEKRDLDIVERAGTIGIQPTAPAPVIGVPESSSPAYRAGLRTFDVLTHVSGVFVRRFMDLEEAFESNRGETVPVAYLRPVALQQVLGGLADMAVYDVGVVALTPEPTGDNLAERTGFESSELYAAVVPQGSYLYEAGLRRGDKVLHLDGEALTAWSTFRERVLAQPDRPHRLEYLRARDGKIGTGHFRMRREDFTDEYGQTFSRYVLRVQPWVPLAPEQRVDHPSPLRYAFSKALLETVDVTRFIVMGLVRLAQGRLSLDSLSGPITIYEVAGEEGRKGADYFIWVMALLSINLGLLNLMPIPVLDGGHLMFFAVEAAMGRPVPVRARELAHLLGMVVVVALMALAFKNDVEKRWDVIVGQVRELLG